MGKPKLKERFCIMINKAVKAAIMGAAVIGVIGGIIVYCSVTPEYDEQGNMIEMTTVEIITEENEESTSLEETETTTLYETSTETTTTYEAVNGHIVESVENLPKSPVDKYVVYNDKLLKLGVSMEEVKSILGNPIVLLSEETELQTETEQTTAEETTEAAAEETTEAAAEKTDENSHRYREFIIRTEFKDNIEIVKDIEVISDKIKNAADISPIGKEIFEITLSYGVPYYEDWNICRYEIDDNSNLYFKLRDGKVATWGIAINDEDEKQD